MKARPSPLSDRPPSLPALQSSSYRQTSSSDICYDLGGGAKEAITVVISCRLWGRRHAGSGPWPGRRPGGAREGSRVVGQRVGLRTIMRRSVGRGGSAGGRRLRLPLGLVGLRRLRGRVARGVDWAVFALVASGGDGWVMRAGCLGVTGLGGKGADLLGRGWGLLLGASANHVWTRPPGSALRVRGSYRQMDRTIPLGRRGGRDLTGWAVGIQQIQMLMHENVICA